MSRGRALDLAFSGIDEFTAFLPFLSVKLFLTFLKRSPVARIYQRPIGKQLIFPCPSPPKPIKMLAAITSHAVL